MYHGTIRSNAQVMVSNSKIYTFKLLYWGLQWKILVYIYIFFFFLRLTHSCFDSCLDYYQVVTGDCSGKDGSTVKCFKIVPLLVLWFSCELFHPRYCSIFSSFTRNMVYVVLETSPHDFKTHF